jgi:hypothetical protein
MPMGCRGPMAEGFTVGFLLSKAGSEGGESDSD